MPFVNNSWAARVLNMRENHEKGPDLVDNDKITEVKFNLLKPGHYSNRSWRVLDYQLEYGRNGKPGYWALGFYTLDRPVTQVRTKNPAELEGMVTSREIYLVKWGWMDQFPPYRQSGETEFTSWENTLIFPKFAALPKVATSFAVEKGFVFLTKGIKPEVFGFA